MHTLPAGGGTHSAAMAACYTKLFPGARTFGLSTTLQVAFSECHTKQRDAKVSTQLALLLADASRACIIIRFFEEHHVFVCVENRSWAPPCFIVVERVVGICRNQLEHIIILLRKHMSPWMPRASCKFDTHPACFTAFIEDVDPTAISTVVAVEGDALEAAFGADGLLVEDDWLLTQHIAVGIETLPNVFKSRPGANGHGT